MAFVKGVSNKVSKTAKVAAQKTGHMVESTKLNITIGAEEEKIKKKYFELGKVVYEHYMDGEEIPILARAICNQIQCTQTEIHEKKVKILANKNIKLCNACHAKMNINNAFCPVCGIQQKK